VQQISYNVYNARTRVTSRVDILNAQTLSQVRQATSAIGTELHATRFHVHGISQGVKDIQGDMTNVSRDIGEVLIQGTSLDGRVDVVNDHIMSMRDDIKEVARTLKEIKEEHKQDYARLSDYIAQSQIVSKSEVAGLVQTAVYNIVSEMVYRQSRLRPHTSWARCKLTFL
jgi:archaellum component FlaC